MIVGGIWLFFTVVSNLMTTAAVKTIPYSDFLRLAKEGKVTEVVVADKIIQGKMSADTSPEGGESFQTVQVDSSLTNVLDQNAIEYTGRLQSNFLPNLISWIVPVLLFLGVWFFIMRRFQQQQGGFMSLGKSKAKIYIDKEIRRIIDEQYHEAVEILKSNRDIIDQTAGELLESEVIEGDALKTLSEAVLRRKESENADDGRYGRQALAA